MEWNSPSPCPNTVTVRRNPHRKARPTPTATPSTAALKSSSDPSFPEIRSFSINDKLSTAGFQKPQAESTAAPEISNIKVYLRIRSLKRACENQQPKLKPKNAWPRNPAKKKTIKEIPAKKKETGNCMMIGEDSHSVMLTPSTSLQESKRIKSEVFDGFSHVFSGDSTQDEIFSKMMSPIVDDFLKGGSRMLAALGPTGSGKTYTVFGTPKEPGMVPLALQRIFEQTKSSDTKVSRKFVLSIFEIYSEGGKGERMRDLFQDGKDLCLQQSNIKALQEVVIHDATEAELLVTRAMLKRSTAMTNVNSQSSRSQCLINLRCIFGGSYGETDLESNSAVLTIVDLAGAERERRTGNQGARLLESNFINNTSMIFGLCLRSLLEHQKNPKKPLQKHCQNSLLTRFLQDYLEGKKRMTLILTVKSGEDDYLDSSHLLRQASPYTKIKFTSSEDQQKMVYKKRPSQTLFSKQLPKKLKCSNRDVCESEENSAEKENQLTVKDLEYTSQPNSCLEDLRKSERDYQIMKHFARAFLKVLRQHSEKLKVAEDEIQNLRESLANEKSRSLELEKRLMDLKTCSTFAKEGLTSSTPDNVLLSTTHHDGHASFGTVEENLDVQNGEIMNPTMCNVSAEQHHEVNYNQELKALMTLDVQSEFSSSSTICNNSAEQHHDDPSHISLGVESECNSSRTSDVSTEQHHKESSQENLDVQNGEIKNPRMCNVSTEQHHEVNDNQELEAITTFDVHSELCSSFTICNNSAEQHQKDPSQINLGVESECNSSRTSDVSTEQHHEESSQENLDVQNREIRNPRMCNVSAEQHHEVNDNQELEAITTLDVHSELCSSSTICNNSGEQYHEDPSQINLGVESECNSSRTSDVSTEQHHEESSQENLDVQNREIRNPRMCNVSAEHHEVNDNQELEAITTLDVHSELCSSSTICNNSAEQYHEDPSQINLGVESECNSSRTSDVSTEQHHEESSQLRHLEVDITTVSDSCVQNYSSNQNIQIKFSLESDCNRSGISDEFTEVEQHDGDLSQVKHLEVDVPSVSDSCVQNYSSHQNVQACECISDTGGPDDSINSSHVMSKDVHPSSDVEGHAVSSSDLSDSSTKLAQQSSANRDGTLDLPKSTNKTADTGILETINMLNVKPMSTGKPRRRLQPASSVLLKDVSTFDMEDEIDKPKGNRGKKPPACEIHQTQGSMKLVRLLKSSLPL